MVEVKWAVVEFEYLPDHWEGPMLDCIEVTSNIDTIQEAEKLRLLYLQDQTAGGYLPNPQNIKVLSYTNG